MNAAPDQPRDGAAHDGTASLRTALSALTGLMSQWSSLELQRRITADCGVALDAVGVRAVFTLGLQGGAARPSRLADDLHLTRPSTSKLIARLADAEFVERTPDPDDRRAALVALTPAGRLAFDRLFAAGVEMLAEATRDWSADDVDALARTLARFTGDLLTRAAGAPGPGATPAR